MEKKKYIVLLCAIFLWLEVSVFAQNTVTQSGNVTTVSSNYKLRPQDTLFFDIYQEEDIAREVKISNDGTINLPLVNEVNVRGLTLAEARDKLTELYKKDYYVNPQISLSIRGYAEIKVSVNGQVNRPGVVYLNPEQKMTVTQVIAAAGSYTRLARTSKIILRRDGKDRRLDLDKPSDDIEIVDGDIITVEERIF